MPGSIRRILLSLTGSAILAFGLRHIHAYASVTEGGILGLTLFLEHWLRLSPAVSSLLLNAACYLFGYRTLGRSFIVYSCLSGGCFSLFYAAFERMPPAFPAIAAMPLAAAIAGAAFVGVGAGLCVRAGGAPSGDDALAMSLGAALHLPIERIYLFSDLSVLALCSTYLPLKNLLFSLLSVILSGQIIGLIQKIPEGCHKT